jgi:transposase-like protein
MEKLQIMAKEDKKLVAEKLYIEKGLSCSSIAKQLGVSEGAVYRWKKDAAEKGESSDWDTGRRVYHLAPKELFAMYAETVKNWIVKIHENPEMLADGKIADSMAKHISVLQKLDVRGQYLGAILDLVEQANLWLTENSPEMKTKMEPLWDGIIQHLREYSTMKGMF